MREEIDHAFRKHGRQPWGRHEFYGILKEEVDELWDAIKADEPSERVLKELIEVAAMCLRYAETGDMYRGPHPLIPLRFPCHEGPQRDWCDRDGPGGFMGHTCKAVPPLAIRREDSNAR